jgi:hypothetical protein
VTTSRLEALSDGVLAFAITLLVIEIHPPELGEGETLAQALWAQWPSYLAYLVSFLTIGVIWLNHHRVFDQVAQVDGPLAAPPRCTTGAARTTSATCGICTPSTPAARCGRGPWPTCSSTLTPPPPHLAPQAGSASMRRSWPRSAPGTAAP